MKIHAYSEFYVSRAQDRMGDAFDYAVNGCGIAGGDFVHLFLGSSISRRMENGELACIVGKSGIEIVHEVVYETMGKELPIQSYEQFGRSAEYWIGWAIAYYQWHSSRKYSVIFQVLSFDDLHKMYYTLHEADITKFVDIADSHMKEHFSETNFTIKKLKT